MKKSGGGNIRSILCLALFFTAAAGAFAAEKASLAKTVFAPADAPRTLLTVRERGYYSLRATSKTGTALEVVDRMAGVIGQVSGAPGERDGRIDLLLDPGEYRVNLFPDRDAGTPAELAVVPFREANAGKTTADHPFIHDGDFLTTALDDLQTRSWWIYLPERAELRLELMGRALASCALWQNGQWLTAVKPSYQEREPEKGRPVLWAEFHHTLEAGHYLLVCAGGKPRAWADDSRETALLLRRGVRFLGSNGMQRLTVSPFGRDAYLVAGSVDYLECVRDTLEPTRLGVGFDYGNRSRYSLSATAEITKQSKDPWCRLYARISSERKWLTVEAAPGDRLEVSFFRRGGVSSLPFDKKAAKSYWVSTVSAYTARDLIDLTPIVYVRADKRVSFLKDGAVRVSAAAPFVRKVNLLGVNGVYLFVETPGTYRVAENAAAGGTSRYRLTLLENRFLGGKEGDWKTPDKPFELTRGYYALDLQPVSLGILHFALYREGSSRADDLLKGDPPDPAYAVAWSSVQVPANATARISVNARHQANVGIDVRELPLSLEVPLSAVLAPGGSVEVRVKAEKESVLAIGGEKPSLAAAGKTFESGAVLKPGAYAFTLRNDAKRTDLITLGAVDSLSLRRFPKPVLKSFEDTFPVFTESRPYHADFERGQTRSVLLRVREPALYRIETSGRLALGLSVRTPLVPDLVRADENGAGRNALVMTYLKPGDYLVAVSARGRSRGRAGVSLKRTQFADLGDLPPDLVSRRTVEADVGLRYALTTAVKSRYSVSTLGLGVEFPFRLEDAEGFPLAVGSGGAETELDPGAYAWFSLPAPFTSRRLTTFTRIVPPPPENENAKRFELALNRVRRWTWKETAGRAPDVYVFALPAPLSVTVSLSTGMRGTLASRALPETVTVAGGRDQELDLPAGAYELAVSAEEERNLFAYQAAVFTSTLAAGLSYPLAYDAAVYAVSAGGDGIYDFTSSGGGDYKASLWDETGARLIAESDDAENDWNFRITRRLAAGRYLLRVEPAGYVGGGSTVSMAVNAENPLGERPLPFTVEQPLGREILKIPVRPRAEGVLAVRTEAGRAVKFGLYRETDLIAGGEGFLAVPLVKDRPYTLQIWQTGDRPQPVKVAVSFVSPRAVALSETARTLDVPAFLALDNPAALSWLLKDKAGEVLYSTGPESPCLPPGAWIATGPGGRGYLASKSGAAVRGVRLEPAAVAAGENRTAFVGPIPHSFLLDSGRSDVFVLSAETQDRPCGLSISPQGAFEKDDYDFRGMDSSDNKTFALLPPGGGRRAKLWNLEPLSPGAPDARVNLRFTRLRAESGRLAKGEANTWILGPGRAVRLELDPGVQGVRALLSRSCVAAVWKDDAPAATAAADADNRDVTFQVAGGTLILANYGSADAAVKAIALDAAAAPVPALDKDGIETALSGDGRLTVAVPAGHETESLCLAGEGFEARLLGRDGLISRPVPKENAGGVSVLPARPGDLEITYARAASSAGWVRIFFSRPAREAEGLAGRSPGLKAKPIALAAPLTGGESVYSFSMETEAFTAVSFPGPALVALYGGGRLLAVRAGGPSAVVRRLPKGDYEIYVRPLAGAALSGTIALARVKPETIPAGNDGKDYFIGAREVQVFRFEVTEAGGVGVGLAAEADRLRAELYDADSNLLGEGALLFRTLGKGTYYLAVYGGDLPARYRPLVYGRDGSVAGVPPDVIDRYRNQGQPETDMETPEDGEE